MPEKSQVDWVQQNAHAFDVQADAYAQHFLEPTLYREGLDAFHEALAPGPKNFLDAGCGPGVIAREVATRWPEAKISGFDFNVVSYLAWFPPFEGGRIRFGPFGLMGEVGYRFNVSWEVAIRYSFTYITPKLRADARAYGEFQIDMFMEIFDILEKCAENGNKC